MEFKYTNVALALSAALLVGCGSDSSSGSPSYVTDLTESQIATLEENCVEQTEIDAIEAAIDASGTLTESDVEALIDDAIAAVESCDIELSDKYVVLTDTSTAQNAQLVYTLPSAQATGKLTAKLKIDSSDEKLSYITLFNSTGSVKTSPFDLKIGGNNEEAFGSEAAEGESIAYSRETTNGDIKTAITFSTLTWVNVSVEWDKTADEVTIVVTDDEGTELSSDTLPFQTAGANTDVTKVAFQVSDSGNKTTTAEPIAIDDLMVYAADLTTVVINESYDDGELLTDSSDSSASVSSRGDDILVVGEEYVTELTQEQIDALVAVGVDPDTIIVGNMTQEEVDQAVADAIAAASEPQPENKYAEITDTDATDTGELRYEQANATTSGSVSFKMYYPSTESETLKLNLFDDGTSESSMLGMLRFDSGNIQDGAKGAVGTFTMDEWIDVEVTYSIGATLGDGTISLTIGDAAPIAVSTWNKTIDDAVVTNPESVTHVSFMLSSNGSTADDYVGIDDLVVNDGTATFSDDFESFDIDTVLDSDNSDYSSNTFSVTIKGEGEASEPAANQVAEITDTDATDTGELRYEQANATTSGSVSFKMYYPSTESETLKLNLFDTGTSESSMLGMLRFDSGNIQDGAKGAVGTFSMDEWIDVEVTYSIGATLGDGTISLTIGDAAPIAVSTWNKTIDDAVATNPESVTHISFMLSSNGSTADDFVAIDDLVVNDGTATFSDDFEGFDIDTVLDSDNSDYSSNTFSVTVIADPAAE